MKYSFVFGASIEQFFLMSYPEERRSRLFETFIPNYTKSQ
jgi:hypothetical protein